MTSHIIQFVTYALAAAATVMLTSLLGMIINHYILRRKPLGESQSQKIAARVSTPTQKVFQRK